MTYHQFAKQIDGRSVRKLELATICVLLFNSRSTFCVVMDRAPARSFKM
ncbi:hypothetical protein HMPREF3229_00120, partial [Peptoniphilus harei]